MKQKIIEMFCALSSFLFLFTLSTVKLEAATTITSNQTGTYGDYNYEISKDSGTASMTLIREDAYSCQWYKSNAFFRLGKSFNGNQTHQETGNISMKYTCTFQTDGIAYIGAYGWMKDPLVEYYIVENWGVWKPPGANLKGTTNVDGAIYEIYETARINQPSIVGVATFQQYWSVRTSKRTNGTISISNHFNAWESKGMKLGKQYEVSFFVEAIQSSGKVDLTSMSIDIEKAPTPTSDLTSIPTTTPTSNLTPNSTPTPIPTSIIITSDKKGTFDGYDYELWSQNGNDSKMTIKNGGRFSCEWKDCYDSIFVNGKRFGDPKTCYEVGNISVNYGFDSQSSGNVYMGVKGWMSSPSIDYYIIDSWSEFVKPKDTVFKGTINIDGGTYDVYESQIVVVGITGTTIYKVYWSLRMSNRTSGIISVSEHFKAWESLGMKISKINDVSLFAEAHQCSGNVDVTNLSIDIENYNLPTPTPTPMPNPTSITITSDIKGTFDGYDYELWCPANQQWFPDIKASMTIKNGGRFSCEWNDSHAAFYIGKNLDGLKTHNEIGNIFVNYELDSQSSGQIYTGANGNMLDLQTEYFIIDNYEKLQLTSGSILKGTTKSIDGSTYDVYECTRDTKEKQYFSIRTSKRTSGTISVSDHFKAWESFGMNTGKLYDVKLFVIGYQSTGKVDVTNLSIDIENYNPPTPTTTVNPTPTPIPTPISTPVVITSSQAGTYGDYNYELSDYSGSAKMTLQDYHRFNCEWSGSNNTLFLLGKKFKGSKSYQEIGNISVNYSINCQINRGYYYMGVYGSMTNTAKFYILNDWNTLTDIETGHFKGSYTIDGYTYNLYIKYSPNPTELNVPPTYYCVPTSKPSEDFGFGGITISVSSHLKAWECLGLKTGNVDEVSLAVYCFCKSGDVYASGNATVSILSFDINDKKVPPLPNIFGDINGDDAFNLLDSMALAEYLLNKTNTLPNMCAADANVDGKIDILDYLIVRRHFQQVLEK